MQMAAQGRVHGRTFCSFCTATLLSILFILLLSNGTTTSIASLFRAAMQLHPADVFKREPGQRDHHTAADLPATLSPLVPPDPAFVTRAHHPDQPVSNSSCFAADQAAGNQDNGKSF